MVTLHILSEVSFEWGKKTVTIHSCLVGKTSHCYWSMSSYRRTAALRLTYGHRSNFKLWRDWWFLRANRVSHFCSKSRRTRTFPSIQNENKFIQQRPCLEEPVLADRFQPPKFPLQVRQQLNCLALWNKQNRHFGSFSATCQANGIFQTPSSRGPQQAVTGRMDVCVEVHTLNNSSDFADVA